MGPQVLEDVEDPVPARSATLKDPGTPDQIVMEQHNLTHFPSQLWCKMCVESRGHDSPHREQSKKDAVVPQLQYDYGYMGGGGPLQMWEQTPLLEPSTRRWYWNPRRWTCPTLSQQQPSGCVTWGMNALVYMDTKKEFYRCCWTKWQKNVVLKDGAAEKAVSTVRGLAITYLAVITDKIPSFTVTTHSPMLPWTIRHAAWILTRYNVRRDTNDSVRESWTEMQKRDSSIG